MASVFLELACLVTRNAKGGPAKAAIFGSALFGSVSGSAAANVYATGTFTIPLMKSRGYKPAFAGGVEAVFSVLALHTGYVPGTINYETPDPECDLNCMTDGAKKLDPQYALSNSFGFGGTNGSILFKKFTA